MGLAAWLFVGALVELAGRIKLFRAPLRNSLALAAGLPRAAHGMTLAHTGLAVAIAGMIASTAWKVEEIRVMRPGETVEVAGYTYRFDGIRSVEGPNYRSEEHTSELQSLMRSSYAVFCLKKNNNKHTHTTHTH